MTGTDTELLVGEDAVAYLAELGKLELCKQASDVESCMTSVDVEPDARRHLASGYLTTVAIAAGLLPDADHGVMPGFADSEVVHEEPVGQALADVQAALGDEGQLRRLPALFRAGEAMYVGRSPYGAAPSGGVHAVGYAPEDSAIVEVDGHHEALHFSVEPAADLRIDIVLGVVTLVVEEQAQTLTTSDWIQVARRGIRVKFPSMAELRAAFQRHKSATGGATPKWGAKHESKDGATQITPYDFRSLK